ncbi:MAG TPA: ANTAR domain-containing protein [Gaiellales bacterium]|nr:ANTAR domain-containing protein [Gaiellales bacterium]
MVTSLGHAVIVQATDPRSVAELTADEDPDVAIVCLDEAQHALTLIDELVRESNCPVIALLDAEDPKFVDQAAQRGVFAYIVNGDADRLESSFDIVLRRFAEYHGLEGAFARRAVTERAKGILMERHQIEEQAAYNLLRDHSRRTQHRLIDVAQNIVDTHTLLPAQPPGDAE